MGKVAPLSAETHELFLTFLEDTLTRCGGVPRDFDELWAEYATAHKIPARAGYSSKWVRVHLIRESGEYYDVYGYPMILRACRRARRLYTEDGKRIKESWNRDAFMYSMI